MSRHLLILVVLPALVILTGCVSSDSYVYTKRGAVVGTMLGAGVGAVIGNQKGHSGQGALIGGIAGALLGGVAGSSVDEQRAHARQADPPSIVTGQSPYAGTYVTTPRVSPAEPERDMYP